MSFTPSAAGKPPLSILTIPFALESLGVELSPPGLNTGIAASATWPVANQAQIVPFVLQTTVLVTQLWWMNGTAVAGTTDCAIVRVSDLKRLVTCGPQTQAGTSVPQAFNVTDTVLKGPELYYGVLAASSTSATYYRVGPSVQMTRALGVCIQAGLTSNTIPDPLVPATLAGTNYIPVFGLAFRALI